MKKPVTHYFSLNSTSAVPTEDGAVRRASLATPMRTARPVSYQRAGYGGDLWHGRVAAILAVLRTQQEETKWRSRI